MAQLSPGDDSIKREDNIKPETRHKRIALIRAACGIAAVLLLSACASAGHLSQEKLLDIAQNSSCDNPYILHTNPFFILHYPSAVRKYIESIERLDLSGEGDEPPTLEEKAELLTSEEKAELWYNTVTIPSLFKQLDLSGEGDEPLTSEEKAELVHIANVQRLGYKDPKAVTDTTPCNLKGVRVYETALTSNSSNLTRLYVKPMTTQQIKADPNISFSCKPVYDYIYMGGSGDMMVLEAGEDCEVSQERFD